MNKMANPTCGPAGCETTHESTTPKSEQLAGNGGVQILDVFSDTICPWCLIALRRAQNAAASVDHFKLILRWHAFQLNPDMPPEGMDRRVYRSAKFGSWERSLELDAGVHRAGLSDGIEFRHDLMKRTPNTRDSHRLIQWASSTERQTEVVDRLFNAYFCEGRDVGSFSVLKELAEECQLDATAFENWFKQDGGLEEVAFDQQEARTHGIRGVPAFLLSGRMFFSGAPDVESLSKTFAQMATEVLPTDTPSAP